MPPSNGRDGCTCPPWVRCVHFDGKILVLADGKTNPHSENCYKFTSDNVLAVGVVEEWKSCRGCGAPQASGAPSFFDDLPSAETEFHRRQEELLHAS